MPSIALIDPWLVTGLIDDPIPASVPTELDLGMLPLPDCPGASPFWWWSPSARTSVEAAAANACATSGGGGRGTWCGRCEPLLLAGSAISWRWGQQVACRWRRQNVRCLPERGVGGGRVYVWRSA